MWNANTESTLAGYIVQYGTQSGNPTTSIDVGNVTSRTVTGLTAGTTYYFRVVAYNSSGQQSTPSTQVSYTVPSTPPPTSPTITGMSPTSGPTAGGTVITITGTNFAAGAAVTVGGVAGTGVTVISSTQIRATTPAGSAGGKTVQVTNPSGQSASLANGFTYTSSTALTVTSITPSSGPTAGNTPVVILGTNFVGGGNLYVSIGGEPITSLQLVSSTELRGRTPAGSLGAKNIRFTNGNAQFVEVVGAYTYTNGSAPAPTVSSVSPASGPTSGGTTITLTGANFVSGATVRVGGTAATNVVFVSATQLTARTPAVPAGARDVRITNPDGQSATRTGAFTYASAAAPTLTAVSPASGPTAGGTVITVTGTNFAAGASVTVGGVASTGVTVVSSTQIRATTPAGSTGAKAVQVTNPSGLSASLANGFSYTGAAVLSITSITPASGPTTGNTPVVLRGTNFTAGGNLYVSLGGEPLTNLQLVSSTELRGVTPAGTPGLKFIRFSNGNGEFLQVDGIFTYTDASAATAQTAMASATSAAVYDGVGVPAGGVRRYLAEGLESDQMHTQLAIANADTSDAHVVATFTSTNGAVATRTVDVPARERVTMDLSTVPELAGQSFSTVLDANHEVAVDRLISWDGSGLAASLESAVARPSGTWYFAEGSTVDPYELYYLVQNPGATAVKIRVRYLLPNGAAPVVRGYSVPAGGRATIWVDREDPALASTDVAAEISSVTGSPIVVERSLYLKDAGSSVPRGGDTSAGVTAPATSWNVEAATGSFATRLLVANPGAAPAQVQATYRTADGRQVVTSHVVAANSRQTVNVAGESPALANAMVDVKVDASAPVVVERTSSWGAGSTPDETISGGATATGAARWLLAEAELGGDRQAVTSLAVTNRGAATTAKVTLLFEDGPEASETFPVAAGARVAIPVDQAFPMAANRRFSILVEGEDPSASLIVDRTMFWRAAGETRTAGADGAATRLP